MKKNNSKKKKNQGTAAEPPAPPTTRTIHADCIKGSDDLGNYFNTQAELAQHQAINRDEWYATNKEWWQQDGYGGSTDEEAMIGDGGGVEDGVEGLAFLDRLILEASSKNNNKKLKFARAIDAGAGVGRVTKHILLKRYDRSRLWMVQALQDVSGAKTCCTMHIYMLTNRGTRSR